MALSVAIIGTGLMGASFGLAAKARGLASRVMGCDRSRDNLNTAQRIQAIDDISDLETIGREADLIVVSSPVDQIADIVRHCLGSQALITDLGSTKRRIIETIELMRPRPRFVGSHPMAGSEKKGPSAARADLFENRPVILTPTDSTEERSISEITDIWTVLGSNVVRMSPTEHDETVAAISHLPHAVSVALAACTDPKLLPFSAGGWRDTTRIAAAGSAIWTPIFRENRESLLAALSRFESQVHRLRQALEGDDANGITAWLDDAKRVRDALGN